MNIYISDTFNNGWIDNVNGLGNFVLSQGNKILQTNSVTGTNNGAMKEWRFLANPGDVVEVSVWARAISGTPKIALDLRNASNVNVKVLFSEEVKGIDWKLYKYKVQIPLNSPNFVNIALVLGINNTVSVASSGEFHSPRITVETSRATPQLIAQGLIRISNGVASIDPKYKTFGISSVSYDDTDNLVTVNLEKGWSWTSYPIAQVSGIIDNNVFPVVGRFYGGDAPYIKIGFTDGTTRQSLANGSNLAFLSVYF